MGILSGSWLTVGLVLLISPPGSTSDALGLFLLVAGTATLRRGKGAEALHQGLLDQVAEVGHEAGVRQQL